MPTSSPGLEVEKSLTSQTPPPLHCLHHFIRYTQLPRNGEDTETGLRKNTGLIRYFVILPLKTFDIGQEIRNFCMKALLFS